MFLPKINNIVQSIHIGNNNMGYAFPISGLKLNDNKFKVGFSEFISAEEFKKQNQTIDFSKFNNESFVIIKTDNFKINQENDGLNSLALKYIKEVIGYLYFAFYFKVNKEIDKKILISNKLDSNLDEGLVPYFKYENEYKEVFLGNADFSIDFSEIHKCINYYKLPFEIPLGERSEYQNKLFKCFEFLYYINNEIYATERMTKYFLLLNHLFRKDEKTYLNRKGLCRYINYILSENSIEIFPKDFNKNFEKIYDKFRNDLLHGILYAHKETTLVGIDSFNIIKKIFMEILNILFTNSNYKNFENTQSLLDYIDLELKNRRKNA